MVEKTHPMSTEQNDIKTLLEWLKGQEVSVVRIANIRVKDNRYGPQDRRNEAFGGLWQIAGRLYWGMVVVLNDGDEPIRELEEAISYYRDGKGWLRIG